MVALCAPGVGSNFLDRSVGVPIPRSAIFSKLDPVLPAQEVSLQARLIGPKTNDQAMIEDNLLQKKPRHERAGPPFWARTALSHCCERDIPRPVTFCLRVL